MNKEKLAEAFEKVKFQVKEEADLPIMATIVEKGFDVSGKFRDPNDEARPIVFDCMRILNSMDFTDEEKEKAKTLNYIA